MRQTHVAFGKIVGTEPEVIERLDRVMATKLDTSNVIERVLEENAKAMESATRLLRVGGGGVEEIREALRGAVLTHEAQLLKYVETLVGKNEFERAANLARRVANVGRGFFLKKEVAVEILEKRPPTHLLEHFHYASIKEALQKHEVLEIMSTLRFMESDEWMHETFDTAYHAFTPQHFEERQIEIRVLGEEWHDVAKKFVEKKHHNVSHLKEFGVIFINPISENAPGKFIRDFALLLHYFHEIEFYSKLFHIYANGKDFAKRLASLLRGDVGRVNDVSEGEWLIVQRYLTKIDPKDPRLFVPHMNPESLHWARGENDIVEFGGSKADIDLEFWRNLDWVGKNIDEEGKDVLSFDMEDNAMSAVSFAEKKNENFFYHQREALWTKLFAAYVGGEAAMEKLLLAHFDKGIIRFGS